MNNFHETTANGFSKRAEKAYVEYMNGGPVSLLDDAEFYERAAAKHRAQIAPAQAVKPAKVAKPRCQHYAAIKEFFMVAREMGMDTAAKDRARGAVGMLLGKRIESRASLTGSEWSFATNALRCGKLTW